MTKSEAVALFGDTQTALANALGVSRSYISQWPDVLEPKQADRVLGAAVRLGKLQPKWTPTEVGAA
jgi:UTP--glucose-1-phosphate uridylyltransferase